MTVVGAGVVGMATALTLRLDGHAVTVIDRLPPGEATSFGNAGGIAVTAVTPAAMPGILRKVPGWLLDPEGPLAIRPAYAARLLPWLWRFWRASRPAEVARLADALSAINRRGYDDWRPLLAAAGIERELTVNGGLTLYRSDAAFRADAATWRMCRERGVTVEEIGPEEIRQPEPDLAPGFARGVLLPEWGHVSDPYRIVAGLAGQFVRDGGEIRRAEVRDVQVEGDRVAGLMTSDGPHPVDALMVCAGAWSHRLAARLGSKVPLESERGYHVTLPAMGPGGPLSLRRMLLMAEDHYVITPMAVGLRVAGTVEMGGLETEPNMARARVLLAKARTVLPALTQPGAGEGAREWSGHRPALPDTVPVISASPGLSNLFYGFGHGHLGLTNAATTGRILADLLAGHDPGLDMAPYRVDRF